MAPVRDEAGRKSGREEGRSEGTASRSTKERGTHEEEEGVEEVGGGLSPPPRHS